MILASVWLTTIKDRHAFNVWHHQRDVIHVWRHWWYHNGNRDRAYCNAAIVTWGHCTPAPSSPCDVVDFNFRPFQTLALGLRPRVISRCCVWIKSLIRASKQGVTYNISPMGVIIQHSGIPIISKRSTMVSQLLSCTNHSSFILLGWY